MRAGFWKGVGFGLTSGVITTLGLIIGLHSGTQSKIAVIVGIVVLAIADALSDSMGIHISEEAENEHTSKEIWESSFFTFFSKFFIAMSFVLPVVLLEEPLSILVSLGWGLCLIGVFSFRMAISQGENPYKVVGEHLTIVILVIILAHIVGDLMHEIFLSG
ncbi:MAG: hypothetical protein RMJ07_03110 [Nitrososphaerota archaeon]|nr:hypothetical protein [Candidatus Bathyarchaeota archaeon]MDW8048653.1 hypothetical protein [Nitrososphaerota archaeon]